MYFNGFNYILKEIWKCLFEIFVTWLWKPLRIQSSERCLRKVILWWKYTSMGKQPSWMNYAGLKNSVPILRPRPMGQQTRPIRWSRWSPQKPIRNSNVPNAPSDLPPEMNSTCTSLKAMTSWRLRWTNSINLSLESFFR